MKNITVKHVILAISVLLLLIFTFQNLETVRVHFLFFDFGMPLVILIVLVFFIGFFTAWVMKKLKKKNIDLR
ncbi:MAG: LapA family protein [Bacteroidales bacterium]|nr:LapA family protein [Bacteroidales bacterium]HOY39784.1 LapA family protein [Bacteroidales bacterium]HQP03888.1 LapA family protein [Bacteroidales bacterium]